MDRLIEEARREFISDPNDFSYRRLISYLARGNIDISTADDIYEFFGGDKEAIKVYVENMEFGDPSSVAASLLVDRYPGFKRMTRWVKSIIENADIGDPTGAAFRLIKHGQDYDTIEWVANVIVNTNFGYPAKEIFSLYRHGYINMRDVRSIIRECPGSRAGVAKLIYDSNDRFGESLLMRIIREDIDRGGEIKKIAIDTAYEIAKRSEDEDSPYDRSWDMDWYRSLRDL